MMDQKHNAEVEKTFKKAICLDRARIQLSHISKFGIMELSRQKKQSTIQEISYTPCPFCRGRGVRPSLEYTALTAYRKIETQAVKGLSSQIKIGLPYEVADYLLNQKRSELSHLENEYDMSISISGKPDMAWDEWKIETTKRETAPVPEQMRHAPEVEEILDEIPEEIEDEETAMTPPPKESKAIEEPKENGTAPAPAENLEPAKKRSRRRSRHRRKKPGEKPVNGSPAATPAIAPPAAGEPDNPPAAPPREPVRIKPPAAVIEPAPPKSSSPHAPEAPKGQAAPAETPEKANVNHDDPLHRLKKVFETLID
jgi:ribonuclease E